LRQKYNGWDKRKAGNEYKNMDEMAGKGTTGRREGRKGKLTVLGTCSQEGQQQNTMTSNDTTSTNLQRKPRRRRISWKE